MSNKLFLGGISPMTSKEVLEAHFAQYGNVIDAVVMYKDGKHRGFGFVTFDAPEAVQSVLLEPQVIDGRNVDVKEAMPQGEAPPPQNNYGGAYGGGAPGGKGGGKGKGSGGKVFVGGLPQSITDDMLREYFSRYGNLIDVVVMKDRITQKSRGFGFVQYDDESCVDQVIAEYSTHELDGKWVEVKAAVARDSMAAPKGGGKYGKGGGKGPPAYGGGYGKGAYAAPPAYGGGAYGGAYGGGAYVAASYGPPPQQYYQPSPYGGYGPPAMMGGGKGGYRARPY